MDPFVHRLVLRLLEPQAPLSRNKHFVTFENPEGRAALRIVKRLKGLERDVRESRRAPGASAPRVERAPDGRVRLELTLDRLQASRVALLDDTEYELLSKLTGALSAAPRAR